VCPRSSQRAAGGQLASPHGEVIRGAMKLVKTGVRLEISKGTNWGKLWSDFWPASTPLQHPPHFSALQPLFWPFHLAPGVFGVGEHAWLLRLVVGWAVDPELATPCPMLQRRRAVGGGARRAPLLRLPPAVSLPPIAPAAPHRCVGLGWAGCSPCKALQPAWHDVAVGTCERRRGRRQPHAEPPALALHRLPLPFSRSLRTMVMPLGPPDRQRSEEWGAAGTCLLAGSPGGTAAAPPLTPLLGGQAPGAGLLPQHSLGDA
jgi:hypothetical protein